MFLFVSKFLGISSLCYTYLNESYFELNSSCQPAHKHLFNHLRKKLLLCPSCNLGRIQTSESTHASLQWLESDLAGTPQEVLATSSPHSPFESQKPHKAKQAPYKTLCGSHQSLVIRRKWWEPLIRDNCPWPQGIWTHVFLIIEEKWAFTHLFL